MTGWVDLKRSTPVSRHIAALCAEASDSTYVRDADIRTWATLPGKHFSFSRQFFASVLFVLSGGGRRRDACEECVQWIRIVCVFIVSPVSMR